ncbi:MAG: hypothetical protein LJE84_08020 [Gammaproteobacteria bacterium]|jgi:hypothetical protein|nr:hypothetical protein [Gammaproteobacteria bacterium]
MKKLFAWSTALFLITAAPAMAGQQIVEKTPLSGNEVAELQVLDTGSVDDMTAGYRGGGGGLLVIIIVAAAVAVLVTN